MSARACIVRRLDRWRPRSTAKAVMRIRTGSRIATMRQVGAPVATGRGGHVLILDVGRGADLVGQEGRDQRDRHEQRVAA